LTHNTRTLVTWETEDWDTASCFDLTTERFTPNIAGYYLLHFNGVIIVGSGVSVEWWGYIRKNGTDYATDTASHVNYGGYQTVGITTIAYANGTTDYFDTQAYQYNSSSSAYNLRSEADYTWFEGALIRPA